MPLRVLSYTKAAQNIRDTLFPQAQLQIVTPICAAEKINGTDRDRALFEAGTLATIMAITDCASAKDLNIVHAFATDVPDDGLTGRVVEVLSENPKLEAHFTAKARAGKQETAAYVAAHLLLHDTQAGLYELGFPIVSDYFTVKEAPRIISIGAQSERPFYLARMACRQAGVLPDKSVEATGQLFTRHVLAPYIACRQGEPGVLEAAILATDVPFQHTVPSVERDLRYLQDQFGFGGQS
jgi:hypothetical protein